jgi:hypothetical protein
MKIVIETQVMENYGDADKPYWKAKGGNDYVIENVQRIDYVSLHNLINRAKPQVECDNEYFREWIIDWSLHEDDYLTSYERDQLEYDGSIQFPAQKITF